jgi:hypothetical protein
MLTYLNSKSGLANSLTRVKLRDASSSKNINEDAAKLNTTLPIFYGYEF